MLSVVVPTHNRASSVTRLAKALDAQECGAPCELVFVLDGCTDGTSESLGSIEMRAPARIVEIPGLGAAAARNEGVSHASGDLILFIDDDEVPQPGMLEAHVKSHESGGRMSVIGPYPYAPEMSVNPLDFHIREWWRVRYRALADPTHVFTYRDCLSGNLSIHRRDFEAVGGFDADFEYDGREDYELGARLLKSGIGMKFVPAAAAYHYPNNRPRSLLKKWYTFGRADVHFVQKHPEVFGTLPIRHLLKRPRYIEGLARGLLLTAPSLGMTMIGMLGAFFERDMSRLWDRRFLWLWNRSQRIAYLYGILSAVGGLNRLEDFIRDRIDPRELPKCTVRIGEVGAFSDLREIGGVDGCDKLYLIARGGGDVTGWVGVPCCSGQDAISIGDLAECVSEQVGWNVWQSFVSCGDGHVRPEEIEKLALKRLEVKVRSLPNTEDWKPPQAVGASQPSVSAVVFCKKDEGLLAGIRGKLGGGQVACIVMEEDGLRSKLKAALSACRDKLVVLLAASDVLDDGWLAAACRHFAEKRTSCVLTPVIRRGVSTRGEELYHELVDFNRVKSWKSDCLTDWMHPGEILASFGTCCHRLVFRKDALDEMPAFRCMEREEIPPRLLHETLQRGGRVIYEPRAIIWQETPISTDEVRGMALRNSRLESMIAAETIDKAQSVRILSKVMRSNLHKLARCVRGSKDWPVSFAAMELVAAIQGVREGLLKRNKGESEEAQVTIREDKGVIWVS